MADDDGGLRPGNLVVSRSVYDVDPSIVPGVTQLPPNCVAPSCVTATAGGAYPMVFNNALAPNKLVRITDTLAATTLPAGESFAAVRSARADEVLRGISFTPGTGMAPRDDDDGDDHDDDHGHDRDGR